MPSWTGRKDAFADYASAAMDRRLVDAMIGLRHRSRVGVSAIALILLASIVHVGTLALVVSGAWLLVVGNGVQRVLGVILLVFAAAVNLTGRTRTDRGPGLLDPEFPAFTRLVAEVASCVRAPMPHRVEWSIDVNASVHTTRTGRRVLTIGAPLWAVLGPQARVALLGHELGHFANGDALSSGYVGAAGDTAAAWHTILSERAYFDEAELQPLFRIVTKPARVAIHAYVSALNLLSSASRRRMEAYADLASAKAGGTAGSVDLLESLLAKDGIEVVCNRTAITGGRRRMRAALAEAAGELDGQRRAALRRSGALEKSTIDASHPLTVERLRLIEGVEQRSAEVVVDGGRRALIDAELEASLDLTLAELADTYLGR